MKFRMFSGLDLILFGLVGLSVYRQRHVHVCQRRSELILSPSLREVRIGWGAQIYIFFMIRPKCTWQTCFNIADVQILSGLAMRGGKRKVLKKECKGLKLLVSLTSVPWNEASVYTKISWYNCCEKGGENAVK